MKESFRKSLLEWYQKNKRDLPWRQTRDPYVIWITEIIFQQTRIEQGLPYYYRFIEKIPDIQSLARATEDEVMKVWQGLGYYSRARNMQETAKVVAEQFQGVFPEDYSALKKLKGIGDYTASLIASVCFGQPYAVLDGNVFRVVSRIKSISEPINTTGGKKVFQQECNSLLDKQNPGDFNQAMMELGALICKPQQPECPVCPVADFCLAFKQNTQATFPVKLPREKLKERFLSFIFIRSGEKILIGKRNTNDIWKSLYQLPLIEKQKLEGITKEEISQLLDIHVNEVKLIAETTHLLTHRKLYISFYEAMVENEIDASNGYNWVESNMLRNYAFPKPVERFLDGILKDNGMNPAL